MEIEIVHGDITALEVDAIVNAANSSLMGGGGVDGAIHQAAGPLLLDECKKVRQKLYPAGLPTGKAVMTNGYQLPAKYVIHTVGPVYHAVADPEKKLTEAYKNCLSLAEEHGLISIAFPAISTGVYGYPKDKAQHVVKKVLDSFEFKTIEKVILCYFSPQDAEMARKIFT